MEIVRHAEPMLSARAATGSGSPAPFRTECARRTGTSARLADVLLTQLASGGAVPADCDLRGWLMHPDERVPVLLVREHGARLATDASLGLLAYARAARDASEDGLAWTPLLDALCDARLWPVAAGETRDADGATLTVSPATPAVHLESLVPWLETRSSAADIRPLLEFRATPVWATVAEHAACLDTALVTRLLHHSWAQITAAARNRRLGAAQAAMLAEVAARWLAREPERAAAGAGALAALRAAGHRSPGTDARALVPVLRQAHEHAAGEPMAQAVELAIESVLNDPDASTDVLRQVLRACRWAPVWLCRLAVHHQASPVIWADSLRVSRDGELRRVIARIPAARADVIIRRLLAQSSDTEVLCRLAEDADPLDLAYVVRRLATSAPVPLLEALGTAAAGGRLRARPADVAPLLTHADPAVRQQAAALFPQLVLGNSSAVLPA